jgi:hypothetical protein
VPAVAADSLLAKLARGSPLPSRVMRIGNREVKLTNLDKVFFPAPAPGLTKGDLVQYYIDVAPYAYVWSPDAQCR